MLQYTVALTSYMYWCLLITVKLNWPLSHKTKKKLTQFSLQQSSRVDYGKNRYTIENNGTSGADSSGTSRTSNRNIHLSRLPNCDQRCWATIQIHTGMFSWAFFWFQRDFHWYYTLQINMYVGVFTFQPFSQQYAGIQRAPTGHDSCWMSTNQSSSISRKCEFRKHNLNCQEVLFPEGSFVLIDI